MRRHLSAVADARVARGSTRSHAETHDTDRPISTVGDLPLSILG